MNESVVIQHLTDLIYQETHTRQSKERAHAMAVAQLATVRMAEGLAKGDNSKQATSSFNDFVGAHSTETPNRLAGPYNDLVDAFNVLQDAVRETRDRIKSISLPLECSHLGGLIRAMCKTVEDADRQLDKLETSNV